LDFVFIDTEHIPIGRETLSWMCRTYAAIENLDAILSVPGLDAVLIGPHDLSVSLGIPEQYRDPAFDRAVRDIIKRAREHDRPPLTPACRPGPEP